MDYPVIHLFNFHASEPAGVDVFTQFAA